MRSISGLTPSFGRSENVSEQCLSCKFWFHDEDLTEGNNEDGGPVEEFLLHGDCKRFPPVLLVSLTELHGGLVREAWVHPVRAETDYCGEWQRSETTLTPI